MKIVRIISAIAFFSCCFSFVSIAQEPGKIVFFSHQYIDTLREKSDSKITIDRAITQASKSPIHKTYQVYVALIAGEELLKDIKKGNKEKFKAKYSAKFLLKVFLNGNKVSNKFDEENDFRYLTGSSMPSFETADGKYVISHLLVLENYMSNENKKFVINGNNVFRFELTFENKLYAKGEINLNLNKFDPHGSFCEITTPKLNDPAYLKQVENAFKNFNGSAKLEAVVLFESEKMIMKNDLGIPLFKYMKVEILYQDANGSFFSKPFNAIEHYEGGEKYAAPVLEVVNSDQTDPIDELCVKGYKLKYGIK